MAKTAYSELLDSLKLISRKISMTVNSWNFHTAMQYINWFHVKLFKLSVGNTDDWNLWDTMQRPNDINILFFHTVQALKFWIFILWFHVKKFFLSDIHDFLEKCLFENIGCSNAILSKAFISLNDNGKCIVASDFMGLQNLFSFLRKKSKDRKLNTFYASNFVHCLL